MTKLLTKGELKDIIAEAKGIKKGEAETWLEDVFATFEGIVLEKEQGFKFGNLGTFTVKDKEAQDKSYHNPQNGEKGVKHIPAHKEFKFTAGKGVNSVKTKLFEQTKQ